MIKNKKIGDYMKPKVLISAPIGGLKQYSINDFFEWIAIQEYDNFEVAICVNGEHSDELVDKLNQVEIYHKSGTKKIHTMKLVNSDKLSIIQKITYSREKLRRYAIDNNYDYLFFLDTDTIPMFRDAVDKLIKCNVGCVSGLYFYKGSLQPVVVDLDTHTNISLDKINEQVAKNAMLKVWGYGFGCLMLNKETFTKHAFDYDLFGEERSDDFGYCHVLEHNGVDRWFYPTILCQHLDNPNKPVNEASFFKVVGKR